MVAGGRLLCEDDLCVLISVSTAKQTNCSVNGVIVGSGVSLSTPIFLCVSLAVHILVLCVASVALDGALPITLLLPPTHLYPPLCHRRSAQHNKHSAVVTELYRHVKEL